MSSGRWFSDALSTRVSCVVGQKMVTPVLRLDPGAPEPESIFVHRTFETVLGRVLEATKLLASRKGEQQYKVERNGQEVRYEEWPAARLGAWQRPSLYYFDDPSGRWKGESSILRVWDRGVVFQLRGLDFDGSVKGAIPGVPVLATLGVKRRRSLEMTIEAAVDPWVELFVFSPFHGSDQAGVAFESYVNASVRDHERLLVANDADPAPFRSTFYEAYESFLDPEQAARVELQLDTGEVVVTPGNPRTVRIEVGAESSGEMMFVVGARDRETGEVSYSELLPLRVDEDDEGEGARRAHTKETQAKLKARVKARPRPRILPGEKGVRRAAPEDRSDERSAAEGDPPAAS